MNHHGQAIRRALVLGLEVEAANPGVVVPFLTEEQRDWIALWLASEGIGIVERMSADDRIIGALQSKLEEAGVNAFPKGYVLIAAMAHGEDATEDFPIMLTMEGQSPFMTVGMVQAAASIQAFGQGHDDE